MSEMFLPRFMIAAPNSGSGKTTVVCVLLKQDLQWQNISEM